MWTGHGGSGNESTNVMNVADLEVQLLQRIEGNSRGFRDKEKFQLFLIHPSVIYIIFIDPRKE